MSARTYSTPVVLQMEAAECGAASLVMVLASHGRHVTLEEARSICETSRDGVDAARLVRAARSQGLIAKAFMREPDGLDDLPLPLIVHWSFDHFVVLTKVTRKGFIIHDPAIGRRELSQTEFGRGFTGLVIAAEPDATFKRTAKPQSVTSLLFEEAKKSKDAVGIVGLASVISVVPGLVVSGCISAYVDHVAIGGRTAWVLPILVALAITVAVIVVTTWFKAKTEARLRAKIGIVSAATGYWHALHLPLGYYALRSAGEIAGRLRLGAELGGTIAGPLSQAVPNALIFFCYLAIMGFYSVPIAAATAAVSLINGVILIRLSSRVAEANRAYQIADGRAAGVATAGLAAQQTYRALGREDLLIARIAQAEDRALDAEQRLGRLRAFGAVGPAVSGLIISTIILAIGSLMIMYAQLSLGELIALQLLAGLLSTPLAALAAATVQIQEAAGALLRVSDILDHPLAPAFTGTAVPRDDMPPTGHLQLNDVSFGYRAASPVFQNLALTILPGRFVAIIGPSGVGKSTLARLIAGMVEPSGGDIELDGVPVSHWKQSELRRILQYVPQTSAVFTGTIEENVSLWDPRAGAAVAANALNAAGLAQVVASRPSGALTRINAATAELSGGEIQRLALARAFARQPKIMVLDETTSALDGETEEAVLKSLRATGATVIIVTHRRRTVMKCDEAILIAPGGSVTIGAPSTMLERLELFDIPTEANEIQSVA